MKYSMFCDLYVLWVNVQVWGFFPSLGTQVIYTSSANMHVVIYLHFHTFGKRMP